MQSVQLLMLLGLVASVMCIAATRLLRLNTPWLPRWTRFGWLSDLVLSRDPQRKASGRRFLVAVANCLAGVLALNVGAAHGLIDKAQCLALTTAALLVLCGFYALMRSGWSQRLNDPSMVEAQTWATIAFLAWGYLIGGPGRPVALLLLVAILTFTLSKATFPQLLRESLLAAVLFGGVMWRVSELEGGGAATQLVQCVFFSVLVLVLVTLCLLAGQMSRLRGEAQRHQAELRDALARIRELATHDDLTGLHNRRHMLERLNSEKHRSIRSARPFCIAMIDIDHFKRVNDQWGHGTGDAVLAAVAHAIAAGLRETDVVARWGGEEFLVMFTDTDLVTAERVLTRIQQALGHATMAEGLPALRVTFSAGVTDYQPEELLTSTLDRADRALYAAKAGGRARTERGHSARLSSPRAAA